MRTLPTLFVTAAFTIFYSPAHADLPPPRPSEAPHAAEAQAEHPAEAPAEHGEAHGEHHEAHGGHHHAGIVNWWSLDYGPTAKDPEHREWPAPFGFALINFAVFMLILRKLAWKPLKSYVVERHEGIKRELTEAARLRSEADAKLKQYESKLLGLEAEIDKLVSGIRQEAEAERARMIAAAEDQARRTKTEADRQITVEIERARAMLKERVVTLAVAAAEELLSKQMTSEDKNRIADRYVGALETQTTATRRTS